MGKLKDMSFDLSDSITEEQMVEFGTELNKQEHDNYYIDGISLSYKPLLD